MSDFSARYRRHRRVDPIVLALDRAGRVDQATELVRVEAAVASGWTRRRRVLQEPFGRDLRDGVVGGRESRVRESGEAVARERLVARADSKAYPQAATLLAKVGKLMGRKRSGEWHAILAQLREQHARKRNFLKVLDRLTRSPLEAARLRRQGRLRTHAAFGTSSG
jgi:hypothetical protein